MPHAPQSYPQTLELIKAEYRIHKWDGRYASYLHLQPVSTYSKARTGQLVVDPNGMAYAHLAGRPLSSKYTAVTKEADNAMTYAAANIHFRDSQKNGRRGHFPAINIGISSGSGNVVSPPNCIARPWGTAPHDPPETSHVTSTSGPDPPHRRAVEEPSHSSHIWIRKW